ncbi:MAG: hypothetical protein E6Q24_13490 [Chitinophagaceae bacterium]|nr:MAG: hypothetical protein E6Q24_13490 [Chitinophagaceae bacterium]
MQMIRLCLGGLLCTLIACNNPGEKISNNSNPNDSTAASTSATAALDTTLAGCYSSIYKRDTSALQIETRGAVISGPLSYNLFEKDRNDGNFQGEVNGNVLSGWYLFRSEGVMSVRQVAWKIKGNHLWPATGEVQQRGDTMFFKNMDQLQYDSLHPFVKVACTL